MKRNKELGFTIIEVSFFLAISGLMAVGLLASSGATINSHRYRDSVNSLQSQLQHEFTKAENVQNARSGSESCGSNAEVIDHSVAPRGTSECVLLGRYVAIEGDKIGSYPVIARSTATTDDSLNDIDYLKSYVIKADTREGSRLDEGRKWGNSIAYSSGFPSNPRGTTRSVYLLIVRSPKSGLIYSFSSARNLGATGSNLAEMVMQSASGSDFGRTRQVLCVKQEVSTRLSPLGVAIEANITNPNGIQIISNDTESGRC